jgi:membrane-bound lytic murein transglycosylase D
MKPILIFFIFCVQARSLFASIPKNDPEVLSLKQKLELLEKKQTGKTEHFIFDLPVTYNSKVSRWLSYFQTDGKRFFKNWLEKSTKYMPQIQAQLKAAGLPTDLAYMVMIESGFSATAVSSANAVGPWQFISSTGKNYGLSQTHWLDERRDLEKSTQAAIRYLKDLHSEFGSWYLVAASYNMGEGGLRRRIKKYGTADYWNLVNLRALPQETQDYVPKILAAMMISKAPNLYGFRELENKKPINPDKVFAPAGVDLDLLADHLSVTRQAIRELNPQLIAGYIPRSTPGLLVKVPQGSSLLAKDYFRTHDKKILLD